MYSRTTRPSTRSIATWLLAGAALLALFSPAALAADPGAVPGDEAILWAHGTSADGCCEYWTNFDRQDEQAILPGGGYLGPVPTEPVAWEFNMDPALANPLPFKDDEPVVFYGYFTANASTSVESNAVPVKGVGLIDVTFELLQGDDVIASGVEENVTYTALEYTEVRVEAAPTVTTLDPDAGALSWRITANGAGVLAILGASASEATQSRAQLPVDLDAYAKQQIPDPQHIEQALPEGPVLIEIDTDEPTDATYEYHWTTDITTLEGTLDVTARAGSISLHVHDADNNEAYTITTDSTIQETLRLEDAAAGAWRIDIELDGFEGSLTFTLHPADEGDPDHDAANQGDGGQTTEEGNEDKTGGSSDQEERGLPAAPVALLVLTVSGLLAMIRRCRHES